jgi:uncharacterized protein
MSERNGYPPGVPCWVATSHVDPEAAVSFYARLFGWAADDVSAPRLTRQPPPHGSVDFWVDDVDATAARAAELGGRVIVPSYDDPIGSRPSTPILKGGARREQGRRRRLA